MKWSGSAFVLLASSLCSLANVAASSHNELHPRQTNPNNIPAFAGFTSTQSAPVVDIAKGRCTDAALHCPSGWCCLPSPYASGNNTMNMCQIGWICSINLNLPPSEDPSSTSSAKSAGATLGSLLTGQRTKKTYVFNVPVLAFGMSPLGSTVGSQAGGSQSSAQSPGGRSAQTGTQTSLPSANTVSGLKLNPTTQTSVDGLPANPNAAGSSGVNSGDSQRVAIETGLESSVSAPAQTNGGGGIFIEFPSPSNGDSALESPINVAVSTVQQASPPAATEAGTSVRTSFVVGPTTSVAAIVRTTTAALSSPSPSPAPVKTSALPVPPQPLPSAASSSGSSGGSGSSNSGGGSSGAESAASADNGGCINADDSPRRLMARSLELARRAAEKNRIRYERHDKRSLTDFLNGLGKIVDKGLETTIEFPGNITTFELGSDIKVNVTVTNTRRKKITILRWGTPFFAFFDDVFDVFHLQSEESANNVRANAFKFGKLFPKLKDIKRKKNKESSKNNNGKSAKVVKTEVDYIAFLAKLGDPAENDYISFGAKESKSVTLPLNRLYNLKSPGNYTVQVQGSVQDFIEDQVKEFFTRPLDFFLGTRVLLSSETISFEILPGNSTGSTSGSDSNTTDTPTSARNGVRVGRGSKTTTTVKSTTSTSPTLTTTSRKGNGRVAAQQTNSVITSTTRTTNGRGSSTTKSKQSTTKSKTPKSSSSPSPTGRSVQAFGVPNGGDIDKDDNERGDFSVQSFENEEDDAVDDDVGVESLSLDADEEDSSDGDGVADGSVNSQSFDESLDDEAVDFSEADISSLDESEADEAVDSSEADEAGDSSVDDESEVDEAVDSERSIEEDAVDSEESVEDDVFEDGDVHRENGDDETDDTPGSSAQDEEHDSVTNTQSSSDSDEDEDVTDESGDSALDSASSQVDDDEDSYDITDGIDSENDYNEFSTSKHVLLSRRGVSLSFSNECTADQRSQIQVAFDDFVFMVQKMNNRLNERNLCGPIYNTLFGSPTDAQSANGVQPFTVVAQTVSRMFNAATDQSKTFKFNCGNQFCQSSMFAFVQPTNPIFEITLCDHFWSAKPIGGDDTRAGTLVHEMSHFVTIGGTQDLAYGRKNAIALTDEVGIGNADNYEYYGESLVPS
ncbi:hypothetical protein BJ742DRAFT_801274 [Cladochytrium replicatum]|nr:hypothetical protein BJ742DRAFT_801274 [Cladochytrium replicatum]